MKDLIKLKDYAGEDRVIDSFAMREHLKNIPQAATFKTISGLDKFINGFMPTEVIVVSGPTGSGKTLFCQTLTYKLQEQDCVPMWLQFENTASEFHRRFATLGLPYFVQPMKNVHHKIDWVEDRLGEAIVKYGANCLFVDHLHYLFDIYQSRNSSLEIGQIMRELKRIVIEYNIFIVLMAHMTKIPPRVEPDMGHLRDSGMIAAESDIVLIVWRDYNNKDVKDGGLIKVNKNRREGIIDMPHHPAVCSVRKIDGVFREVDEVHEENGRINYHEDKIF